MKRDEKKDEKRDTAFTLYGKLIKRSRKYIPLFIICTILNGLAFFLIFSSVGVLLSQVVSVAEGQAGAELAGKMAWYLMIVTVFAGLGGFSAVGFTEIEEKMQGRLRREMLDGYLYTSEQAAANYSPAEVQNRMNYDLQETVKLIGSHMSGWIFQPLLSGVLSVLWLLSVNWRVALLCVGCCAVNMVIMYLAAERLRELNDSLTRGRSRILEFLQECVDGAMELRTFHLTDLFEKRLAGQLKQTSKVTVRYRGTESLRWAVMSFFQDCIAVIALLVLGAVLASRGYVEFSAVMLGLPLIDQICQGMTAVTHFPAMVKQISPNAYRVFEIAELSREEGPFCPDAGQDHGQDDEQAAGSKTGLKTGVSPEPGALRAENVTFSYGEKAILKNISFQVRPGEKVAFVGESGGGKSTILKLLMGFYAADGGRILLGRETPEDVGPLAWRRKFSYLPQDSFLFCDTIERNISLSAKGREGSGGPGQHVHAQDNDVSAAAREAFAEDFILNSPQGYETVPGEDNAGFSGGQIQRLCLARALYRRTPVLLMDEPTASLDAQSEQKIKEAIDGITGSTMVIVVTHRLNLTTDFDRIYVMDNGRIAEWGSHDQLLREGGKYRTLWKQACGQRLN